MFLKNTFVYPNLYWAWSTSMEESSFSEAFLLSINWPSGIALAFRILYLSHTQSRSFSFKPDWVLLFVQQETKWAVLPLPEISIQDPAGESLPADPDTLQHTVTSQLVQDQMVIHRSYRESTSSQVHFTLKRNQSHPCLFLFFYLVSLSHLGWCILQSVDVWTWGWPLVCSGFPAGD